MQQTEINLNEDQQSQIEKIIQEAGKKGHIDSQAKNDLRKALYNQLIFEDQVVGEIECDQEQEYINIANEDNDLEIDEEEDEEDDIEDYDDEDEDDDDQCIEEVSDDEGEEDDDEDDDDDDDTEFTCDGHCC